MDRKYGNKSLEENEDIFLLNWLKIHAHFK
jgi:hypothetical protein